MAPIQPSSASPELQRLREIAGRLCISEKTVGIHVGRIFAKIGVRTRVQASAVLHRSHLTTVPPRRDRSNGVDEEALHREIS